MQDTHVGNADCVVVVTVPVIAATLRRAIAVRRPSGGLVVRAVQVCPAAIPGQLLQQRVVHAAAGSLAGTEVRIARPVKHRERTHMDLVGHFIQLPRLGHHSSGGID